MPESDIQLSLQVHSSMQTIDAFQWDRMIQDNNPFLKHAFLSAMETHGCVSKKFGWIPHHITLSYQDKIIAALPLYEKHNNYGEFVFDQAWEQAWHQVGLNYYPKLVSAVPYTPAQGQRFLIDSEVDFVSQEKLLATLIEATQSLAIEWDMSSIHVLFAETEQQKQIEELNRPNFYFRHDCQFHWFNQGFESFDDFLTILKRKKRKNIKQERQFIVRNDISFRVLNGHTATNQDWENFDFFYQKTFIEKWSTPTFNLGFFKAIANALPDQIVLVLADQQDKCVAGALMFESDTTLYGRHWGCTENIKNLHFETCFYQGIDYAIQKGLRIFEPGAGGEHKIARGFVPVKMRSTHWVKDNPFPEGLTNFIQQEKQMIDDYAEECSAHIPYQKIPNTLQ